MATRFEDPLEEMDPIMAEAFSTGEVSTGEVPTEERVSEPSHNSAVSDIQFPVFEEEVQGQQINLDVFSNIPVNISVEVGCSEISLKEVYELTEGSIIELDRMVGEPLDLVVNGQVIAQGEVVAIDNNFGLRVTSVVARTSSVDGY